MKISFPFVHNAAYSERQDANARCVQKLKEIWITVRGEIYPPSEDKLCLVQVEYNRYQIYVDHIH